MTILFISGIDTEIGKTVACGALANTLVNKGINVCTQKWVETGCNKESQDLLAHQAMVSSELNQHDVSLHSPYRFKFPASPHLAADLEKQTIDTEYLIKQTQRLSEKCDHLIIEGAGGLCVPLNANELMIDLVEAMNLPMVLVTSGRLGSINHTVLSLELCRQRDIEIRAVVYNQHREKNEIIANDTRDWLKNYLAESKTDALWLELENNAHSIKLTAEDLQQLVDR